jgi:hypothetical protein
MSRFLKKHTLYLFFFCFCLCSLSINRSLEGSSAAWLSPGSSTSSTSWDLNSNWVTVAVSGFPNAPGDVASFIGQPTTGTGGKACAIDLGESITIGSLDFNNGLSIEIGSSNQTLTFQGSSNPAFPQKPLATIFVSGGLDTSGSNITYLIDDTVTVKLANDLEIYGTGGLSPSLLEIASSITGSANLTYSSKVQTHIQV